MLKTMTANNTICSIAQKKKILTHDSWEYLIYFKTCTFFSSSLGTSDTFCM